jgi:glyoxylase-like metal-dependent hydrolase (beta-lactamase superfamily II)
MRSSHLVLSLFIASAAVGQQPDYSKVEVKAVKVAGTVYMLTGAGGNIGVSAGDDGIVVVDDQFAPLAPKIRAALKTICDKPIRFILNTHYHPDHTGGNEILGREAPVIAQENVRKKLQNGTKASGREIPPSPKGAWPVVTFNDRLTVHVNGEDIRAVHFPAGHTDGDAVIWFTQSNVIHMGDAFFNGGFPVLDVDNGGSIRGMIAAGEKVLATAPDDARIIPGHGPLGDKTSLRAFVEMLKATSAAVAGGIHEGKSLEDLKKMNVLGPWDDVWGTKFVKAERYLTALYNDLKR